VGRSSAAFRLVSSVVELDRAGGRAGGRGICDSHGRDSGSIMVPLRNYWPDMYGRAAADRGSWAIKGTPSEFTAASQDTPPLHYTGDVRVITKHGRKTNAESVGTSSHRAL